MIKIISKYLLVSLFIISLASNVSSRGFSGSYKKNAGDYFLIDHAVFRGDSLNSYKLEVYYQIYNLALNFEKEDSLYSADYEITVDVYKDKEVIGSYHQSNEVILSDKSKVKSSYDYRTNQVNFSLESGKYEIKINLIDPNSTEVIHKQFKVKLKDYKNKYPILSDIEIVQLAVPSGEELTVFDKGGMTMVPSISHSFGNTGDDSLNLFFYFEIYDGYSKFKKIRIETVLRHFTKGMIYRDSLSSEFSHGAVRQFRKINMDDIPAGEYELIVTIRGKKKKKIAVKYKNFTLFWTQKSMLKHDYKSIVNQLSLVADEDEIKLLKNKKTYEERLKAFNDFWLTRDPTPGSLDNETKAEFYRRVAIANSNFSYLSRSGWRSDRGRIFIRYGEPDQIEDYPIMPNSVPYQEWHYYRTSSYRKFVFIDEKEDGDYRLVYPYDGLRKFNN